VGLTNVWVQTLGDGVVRADQITGIDAHQTPALSGKPSRWLLDVVVSVPIGSGTREGWTVTALHRTLIQTAEDPGPAPLALARLLAQLDTISATGFISTTREEPATPDAGAEGEHITDRAGGVRFRFTPFPDPPPGRHTGTEYL
jgi:hypothetical protein